MRRRVRGDPGRCRYDSAAGHQETFVVVAAAVRGKTDLPGPGKPCCSKLPRRKGAAAAALPEVLAGDASAVDEGSEAVPSSDGCSLCSVSVALLWPSCSFFWPQRPRPGLGRPPLEAGVGPYAS